MRERRQRGSALVTVLLILVILSAIGGAAIFMMRQESEVVSQLELEKAAFYAAESGLRRGEQILEREGVFRVNALLRYDSSNAPETPAVTPTRPQQPTDGNPLGTYDVTHLGTYLVDGGAPQARIQVGALGGGIAGGRLFYSLYIRDNPSDIVPTVPNDVTTDRDARVRLISVGWVERPSGEVMARKVLEEEINFSGVAQAPSAQKLVNAGGTSSGEYGGT